MICEYLLPNSVPTGVVCILHILFANSLDPDQTLQNVGPGLDQNFWHSDFIPEMLV